MDKKAFEGFSVELKGKVAIVLGASAEGGTGWTVAEALARNGAKVVVAAGKPAALEVLAERIGATAVTCDAGDEAQIKALAKKAIDTYGRLDIAVNSASVPVASTISEMVQERLDLAVRVNLFGMFHFVKHMAEAIGSNGSIILISSMSTTHPTRRHVAYAAAKAGADCLVRYAALEYGARNIRVNSILPSAIEADTATEASDDPVFEEALARGASLGWAGYPEDFANTVLFLAGPSHATGMNLQTNGGALIDGFTRQDGRSEGHGAFGSGESRGLGRRS